MMFSSRVLASSLSPTLRFEVKWWYRKMLRMARSLPEAGAAAHYEEHFKAHWLAHTEETDPARIKEIMRRADEDAAWIVDKYGAKPPPK